MSGSNRGEEPRHLGAFGVVTAIILSCLIVGFFAYLEGYQAERHQNSTYEYSQAAKRNASIACRDREPAAVADCIYDEIASASEKSEANQDLNAQQWMARWAGILVIITLATTLISWFALRYLRDTFIETSKAVKETAKATKAMRKANKIAKGIGNAQSRGYISFKFESWFGQFDGSERPLTVDIRIQNLGNTPCRNVIIRRAIALLPFPLKKSPVGLDCGVYPQQLTVWPKETTDPTSVKADRIFSKAEIFEALDPKSSKRIYLVVSFEYVDFDGISRKTDSVHFIEPTSVKISDKAIITWVWAVYSEYNEMT